MADPTLLYCVGATKAGTSWLYRHLHDHPACKLRAVKEAHYWDTFNTGARDKQLAAFETRLARLEALREDARGAGRGWQVDNTTRQIDDLTALMGVVGGDRAGDVAYGAWLMDGAQEAAVVADMTPNYALLPAGKIRRMAALSPMTRFVYLLRDPVERLWSHVRMQAKRQRQDHEEYTKKANNILWRVVNAGKETHITDRGDYAGTVARFAAVVPAGHLLVEFAERMFTPAGLSRLSAFLGIEAVPAAERAVHAGQPVVMRDDLRERVAGFLKDQYEWAARTMGPLPDEWQENYARALA